MRRCAALLLGFGLACGSGKGPEESAAPTEDPPVAAAPRPGLRPQPKPGERVRQPELDGYCTESGREDAFYYHGGSPVVRVAREDGCVPLYITECEAEGQCSAPRDQEPGMWCCATQDEQQNAHAAR